MAIAETELTTYQLSTLEQEAPLLWDRPSDDLTPKEADSLAKYPISQLQSVLKQAGLDTEASVDLKEFANNSIVRSGSWVVQETTPQTTCSYVRLQPINERISLDQGKNYEDQLIGWATELSHGWRNGNIPWSATISKIEYLGNQPAETVIELTRQDQTGRSTRKLIGPAA